MTNVPTSDLARLPIEGSFIGVMGLEIDDLVEVAHRRGRMPGMPKLCRPVGIVHAQA